MLILEFKPREHGLELPPCADLQIPVTMAIIHIDSPGDLSVRNYICICTMSYIVLQWSVLTHIL